MYVVSAGSKFIVNNFMCIMSAGSVLESILTVDACRSGLPAIQDLLSHMLVPSLPKHGDWL